MKLTPMSDAEYEFWSARSYTQYAEDKMKAMDITMAEAEKIAKESFAQLLPEGLHSKDNFLYSVKNDKEDILGYVWMGVRGENNDVRAFIYDIVIEEEHRGKGFGKNAMLLIEKEAKKKGYNKIGLHVFGFNKTAINLYLSIGYQTTDLLMEKNL